MEDPRAVVNGVDGLLGDVDDVPGGEHLSVLLDKGVGCPSWEQVVVVLADQRFSRAADQLLPGPVEAHEPEFLGVFDEDHVGEVLQHRVQEALGAVQLLLRALAFGDVLGGGVDQPFLRDRPGAPEHRAVAAVLATVTVLEGDRLVVRARQAGCFGLGLLAVVGVDELDERLRTELLKRPAEGPLPGRIEAFEVAIESDRAQQVGREFPEAGAPRRHRSQAVRERSDGSAEDEEGRAAGQIVHRALVEVGRPRHVPDGEQAERQRSGG